MKIGTLVLWVLIWQIPLWTGAPIVRQNMDWYHTLARPFYSPPDWLFGMVWAALYILLALAAFCMTRQGFNSNTRKAAWLMVAQWVLNTAWTPLFFGLHHLLGAMVLILVMIGMSVWLMRTAKPLSRTAVWLLTPYLAWLCFAWLLNTSVWIMN